MVLLGYTAAERYGHEAPNWFHVHSSSFCPEPEGYRRRTLRNLLPRIETRFKPGFDAQDTSQPASEPTLKPNPLEALRKFEPGQDEEYHLGKGDEITVDFAGRPEMQAKLIVGPDGRITLPLAGDVMIADLTRAEAATAIESALAKFYTNLSVQVTVTKYTANRVLLLGRRRSSRR